MVRFAPRSASCDVIVKIAPKKVIEFQMKSGITSVDRTTIDSEILKSVVCNSEGYQSLFVILCASGVARGVEASLPNPYIPDDNPDITVYIPTGKELEAFFGKKLLAEFKKSPGTPGWHTPGRWRSM